MPHGGKRVGAGRKPGPNALAYGERKALAALRKRIPVDAHEDDVAVADEARDVMLDVMRGGVHWQEATARLKAATAIRLEVCGPIAQRMEHTGADGKDLSVSLVINGMPVKPTGEKE